LRLLAVAFVGLSLIVADAAQAPAAKKKTAPKSTRATAAHAGGSATVKSRAGTAKKSATKAGTLKSTAKAGTRSKRAVVARRPPVQMQPTTDRYKEIQQALADKGYFRGTPDGTWGSDSVDALKRFQKDQNLDPDGKIGSLSLMALGLGPKRGVASAQSVPTASEPVEPPPVAQPNN
jgi:peptidoglycan hydrolase-like protein with peptidoglycan-binding domain